ncbi:chorismate lyase [Paraperlucidibaca baekdonensis]|uniref:Probable chorismate pyruvate-lyase n=1 Tax=Paraperlucidibaca baekdonensis TaxID=748120 RepID=A0A3E0H9G6_9GAMM|nr:chorismate lyase [Paraperlucidibaca baekdonensis]REH40150.1 chorismate lyase [Paraperlucidibaca baekdonensis]
MQNSQSKWSHPHRWQHASLTLRQPSHRALRSWLAEPGSLTARLAALAHALGGELRITVVHEGWHLPRAEEARALGLRRGEFAWIREVVLSGLNQPWVQARSVLPRDSLQGLNRRLTRLGTQSLGSLLFRDPALVRGRIYYARLMLPSTSNQQTPVWARRSRFILRGRAVLVAEAFLPALLAASAMTETRKP